MLTINGKKVEFKEGASVLEVASDNDIYIPTLCSHSDIDILPFGACRLCLVKIENMKGFPAACSTPAVEGMKIITDDPDIRSLRRNILKLIFSEHPNSCIICKQKELCDRYHESPTKAGKVTGCNFCPNKDKCELKKIAEYLEIEEIGIPFSYKNLPIERDDPFFDRDYNLCILCGLCVRVCQEIRGVDAIAFTKRGHDAKIGTAFNKSYLDSGCQFCGACIDVCPTGALSARGSKWHGKPEKEISTTCALCDVGCSLILETKWDKIMAVHPDKNGQANKGQACVRGRFAIPAFVNGVDRLKYPLIRQNGKLVPASWQQAIEFAIDGLTKYSPNEIGFFASPFLSNEAAYLLQKFARVGIKTNNIDIASIFDSLVAQTQAQCIGVGAGSGSIKNIEKADWIIVIGADIPVSHPVISVSVNKARKCGALVSLIGSVRNISHRTVDNCIDIKPSDYLPLIINLLKVIVEKDAFDNDFVSNKCNYFDALKTSLSEISFQECGVSQNIIENLASTCTSNNGCILYGSKILETSDSKQLIYLLFNILLLKGSSSGLVPLKSGGNSQGVSDMMVAPNFLTEYQPTKRGMNYPEMLKAVENGSLKAIYATDEIQNVSLKQIDFLVLHAIYPSPNFETANVVFPVATFTEENGTITSLERRIQSLAMGAKPPAIAKPDWKIICMIAKKMKIKGFEFENASKVFDEICKVNHLISGKGIWSLQPLRQFTLTPVEKLAPSKNDFHKESEWYYRGIDMTEKVHDLKRVADAQK